jgi:hypothetical protein
VKNRPRLRNAEGPKNTSLSSLPRNDYNIPSARWPHHATGTRDLAIHLPRAVVHHSVGAGTVERVQATDDSPSHLQHYINRRVGVKLP